MNVCFLNDVDFLGGGEVWALRACLALKGFGHRLSIASPQDSALHVQCKTLGLDHISYVKSTRSQGPRDELGKFLDARQVDLLYCTVIGNFCEARALGKLAEEINASRSKSRMAVILKTGLPPIGHLTPQHYGCGAGPAVRRLHVVAPEIKRNFQEWEPAFCNGFIEVFREGVELEQFRRNSCLRARERQRWHISADATVVTCLARLVDRMKGQTVLMRAISRLLELHSNTVFIFAGDGEDRQLLEELAVDSGIAPAVRFLGHVDDTVALLNASDIVCHPSLHDGTPNAIVEAMAMGLPVVATEVGAVHELVSDGVSGLLVRPNDVGQLASALYCLCRNDGEKRQQFGEQGKLRVQENWNLNKNVAALSVRLCEELIEFAGAPERKLAPPCSQVPSAILFVVNSMRTGGEETEIAILAKYLDRRRFMMSVLSLEQADEVAPALEKIRDWGIAIDSTCHKIPAYRQKVEYLLQKVMQEGVRVVVACHNPQVVYGAFAHLSSKKYSLIEHGGVMEDIGKIPKKRTARYIGVSANIVAGASQRMERPEHAVILPSMVDTEEFDSAEWSTARAWRKQWIRDECLRRQGFPDDTCVVVFVGRLDPRKKVEDFIRAASAVYSNGAQALFLVVGCPDAFHRDYATRLEHEALPLLDAHRLVFMGPRSDVAGVLCAADILVMPGTGEGMSHVINEAGAAGLAVLASDDGAAREQLDDGACGLLFAPGSIQELTQKLTSLIEDRALRNRLGRRLKRRVNARYAAKVVIQGWHSLLDDVIQELDEDP
jgi:glycosyltransferase involved in cell wall biosynthesis